MKTSTKLTLCMLATVLGVRCDSRKTTHVLFAADHSEISQKQLTGWRMVADQRAGSFCPGDSVSFLVIDGNTAWNHIRGPFTMPVGPFAGQTLDQMRKSRQDVQDFKAAIGAALDETFTIKSPAPATDIVGVFGRVRQPTEVVVFTDALQATKDLNLEITPIRGNLPGLVAKIASTRGLSGALAGSNVEFVHAWPEANGKPVGPNSPRDLQAFWTATVQFMGGNLSSFETGLPKKGGQCNGAH